MKDTTLCIIINDSRILLGLKKRGFGEGKLNGFGGKIEMNESIERGAVRELREETGIITSEQHLKKVGELAFRFPHIKGNKWDQLVHVFIVNKWNGEALETEEMKPVWIDLNEIPFDKMWDDDKYWLPLILENKKVRAEFVFNKENKVQWMKVEKIN